MNNKLQRRRGKRERGRRTPQIKRRTDMVVQVPVWINKLKRWKEGRKGTEGWDWKGTGRAWEERGHC